MKKSRWDDPHRLELLAAQYPHGWRDTEGRAVGEPWHFTYHPALDSHPAPPTPTASAGFAPALPFP